MRPREIRVVGNEIKKDLLICELHNLSDATTSLPRPKHALNSSRSLDITQGSHGFKDPTFNFLLARCSAARAQHILGAKRWVH